MSKRSIFLIVAGVFARALCPRHPHQRRSDRAALAPAAAKRCIRRRLYTICITRRWRLARSTPTPPILPEPDALPLPDILPETEPEPDELSPEDIPDPALDELPETVIDAPAEEVAEIEEIEASKESEETPRAARRTPSGAAAFDVLKRGSVSSSYDIQAIGDVGRLNCVLWHNVPQGLSHNSGGTCSAMKKRRRPSDG